MNLTKHKNLDFRHVKKGCFHLVVSLNLLIQSIKGRNNFCSMVKTTSTRGMTSEIYQSEMLCKKSLGNYLVKGKESEKHAKPFKLSIAFSAKNHSVKSLRNGKC